MVQPRFRAFITRIRTPVQTGEATNEPSRLSANGTVLSTLLPMTSQSRPASVAKRAFSAGRFALLLGILIFAAWPKVLLGIEAFFFRDYGVLGYPFVHFHREAFWRGELPMWNPLSNCGAPFLAQWGTMTLYPFSLIYLVLPLPWSLGFFCLFHLFLAGFGLFHLARRWTNDDFAASIGGIAFVFNGAVFSCLLWPNYTVALAWMPWIVVFAERAWRERGRAVVITALLGALQMLSGVPELIVFTWAIVFALWITAVAQRRLPMTSLLTVAAIIALVASLAACQLLPFFDLLASSHRTPDTGGVKWAMPGWGWANLFLPLFHTYNGPQGVVFQHEQAFMTSYYPGIAILLLAIWGVWRVRTPQNIALFVLLVLSYILALGPHGQLFTWIKEAVPSIGFARFPVKFVLLATFAVPLLAAVAVAHLRRQPDGAARDLSGLSLAALLLMATLLWFAGKYPYPLQNWTELWQNSALRVVFLLLTLTACLLVSRVSQARFRVAAMVGCVALIALDAITHTRQQNPTIGAANFVSDMWQHRYPGAPRPTRVAITPDAEARLLRSSITNATHDFLTKRLALWSNLNLLDGIAKVNGSSTLQLRHQKDVERTLYPTNGQRVVQWSVGLLDFLGVTHLTGTNLTDWARRTTALPIVTCGQQPMFVSDARALEAITAANFEPRTHAYLPEEARNHCAATGAGKARIDAMKLSAQRISCAVQCDQPTLVVVAQSHHRNWKATIDGAASRVWRANYAFQAVQVPAGQHELILEYRDGNLALGCGVTIAALAVCLMLWRRKKALPVRILEPAASHVPEEALT